MDDDNRKRGDAAWMIPGPIRYGDTGGANGMIPGILSVGGIAGYGMIPKPIQYDSDNEKIVFCPADYKFRPKTCPVTTDRPCSALDEWKKIFFVWLYDGTTEMAKNLNTNREFLFTVAIREGGWDKDGLTHNIPLQNPFGVNEIENGKAKRNKKYSSLKEALEEWPKTGGGNVKFGKRIEGKNSIREFIGGLQCEGYNKDKSGAATDFCLKYNSVNPNYIEEFIKFSKGLIWRIKCYECMVKMKSPDLNKIKEKVRRLDGK